MNIDATRFQRVSHIHRKKPKGRAMHETMRRANNAKSKIDRLVLRKAAHSSQYQIPIKLNQQPVSADLRHAENNLLIEPSNSAPASREPSGAA
jgi:hypothetical protein